MNLFLLIALIIAYIQLLSGAAQRMHWAMKQLLRLTLLGNSFQQLVRHDDYGIYYNLSTTCMSLPWAQPNCFKLCL